MTSSDPREDIRPVKSPGHEMGKVKMTLLGERFSGCAKASLGLNMLVLVWAWSVKGSNRRVLRQHISTHIGMVWYGMVWYGMVWYGMVWYGMVWYGMVW